MQGNAFENIVFETATIVYPPQCVMVVDLSHEWYILATPAPNFQSFYDCLVSHHCFHWSYGWGITNNSWALQNVLLKFVYFRNSTSYENFKWELTTCDQSHKYKFQLEIVKINGIYDIL